MRALTIVSAKVWGGGEQYIYDLSEEMKSQGDVNYVVVSTSVPEMKDIYEKVATPVFADLQKTRGLTDIVSLRNLIKKEKIDTIICQSGRDILLCILMRKLTGAKLVFIKHNVGETKDDAYHRWVERQTDAIICVSKLVYNTYIGSDNNRKGVHVVYNGINPRRFETIVDKKENHTPFTIGYVGRLIENKGVFHLIKAIEYLCEKGVEIKASIIGDGDVAYRESLQEYIQKHNLANIITIFPFTENIGAFYQTIDLLVAPSIVEEAFGLVLCEAMYMQVPVLTTNSGAQEEIIEDGIDGYILHNMTVQALAEKIATIMGDDSIESVAELGQKKVKEKFLISYTLKNIKDILT